MTDSAPDQAPRSSAPTRSGGCRWLRLLTTAALSFAMSILFTIFLLAKAAPLREVIFALSPPQNDSPVYFTLLALFVALAAPLAILIYGLRHGWITWRVLLAAWALVVGVGINLAVDDTVVIMPTTLDEIAPTRPGDAASSKVLLRFAHGQPQPELKSANQTNPWLVKLDGSQKDVDVLHQHRDEIEASWKDIAVLHDWFAELSAFPRIGDLLETPADPVPPFSLIRTYTRYACAHAEVLALDGKGDEALAILNQLTDVSQKMTATSRTLVRIMIGLVVEKSALDRVAFVLEHATTSPAARAELTATLRAGLTGEAGARRMMLVDYVTFMVPMVLNLRLGDLTGEYGSGGIIPKMLGQPLNWIEPLLFNPRATLNLGGNYFGELADRAALRDFAGMSTLPGKYDLAGSGMVPMKNVGGRQILSCAIPAFSKMAEQYWKEQDAMTALLNKLKALDAGK